jgi:outer membrane protein assembly factor BamB
MQLLSRALALPALAVLMALPVRSAPGAPDWPTFHQNLARTGADGAGHPLEDPHLRWKYRDPDGPTAVMSSPAVVGGRLFVGADGGTVYCLDAGNGQPIWRAATDWEVFSSPAVVNGRVYVGEGLHPAAGVKFRCLDATTGSPIWETPIAGHVESSPAVAGGRVYFGAGQAGIVCLDAASGKQRWRFPGRHADASPAVDGGRLYIGAAGPAGPSLLCLDSASGKPLWETGCALPPAGAPAVRDGRLWVAGGSPEGMAAKAAGALSCFDARSGKLLWSVKLPSSVPAVALAKDRVLCGAGECLYAFDARTGVQRWAHRLWAPVSSAPVVAGDRVIAAADDGAAHCLSLEDGHVLWAWSLPRAPANAAVRMVSSPALVDGHLYLAGANGMIACVE